MNILILEDDENRIEIFRKKLGSKHTLSVVNTAADAIALFVEGNQQVVFLDHDLGGLQGVPMEDKNTGSEVVRQMIALWSPTNQPMVIVHSMNPPAGDSMATKLRCNNYNAIRIPFHVLVSSYLSDPTFLS